MKLTFSKLIVIIYVSSNILGGNFLPTAPSVRFIASFFWLFCIVILATYRGNLIAFLAIDKYSSPFESLLELSQQEKYKFGTLGGSAWEVIFQVIQLKKIITAPKRWYSGADQGFPVVGGGAPTLIGGANLRHGGFSAKIYVKMKEFGSFGGGGAGNFCM